MKMRKRCAEYGGKWGVWDKPTMLKLLNEVWASMPIEEFHPDLVWVAKNYPKIKTAGGKWVGWGEEEQSGSRARVLDILYMYGHLHEPINTHVNFFCTDTYFDWKFLRVQNRSDLSPNA